MTTAWVRTTYESFWEALECLPPALMRASGFLLGEPHDHRRCRVRGDIAPTYQAFKCYGDKWAEPGPFYASAECLTVDEYLAVTREEVES